MKKTVYMIALTTFLVLQAPVIAIAAYQQYEETNYDNITNDWKEIDGYWYYFDTDGTMLTGEQVINDHAYTFDLDGRMLIEGIHRDGLEDDLLSDAYVKTYQNWQDTVYALSLINQERTQSGAAALTLDFNLSVIATYRCAHMNKYNYFGHVYDNTYPSDTNWKAFSGISTVLGENIHCYGDPHNPDDGILLTETPREFATDAHVAFVNSSGHLRTMIDSKYTKIGIGFFRSENQTRDYTTALFSTQ